MSEVGICRVATAAAIIASGLALGGQVVAAGEPLAAGRHCVIAVAGIRDGVFVTQIGYHDKVE